MAGLRPHHRFCYQDYYGATVYGALCPLRLPPKSSRREYAFGPRPDEQPHGSIGFYGDAQGYCCEGELRTLSVRAEISILPAAHKGLPNQPGYRVRLGGIEVGAG